MGTHNCHEDADCKDTFGNFTCICKNGFHGIGSDCIGSLTKLTFFLYLKYLVYMKFISPICLNLLINTKKPRTISNLVFILSLKENKFSSTHINTLFTTNIS